MSLFMLSKTIHADFDTVFTQVLYDFSCVLRSCVYVVGFKFFVTCVIHFIITEGVQIYMLYFCWTQPLDW